MLNYEIGASLPEICAPREKLMKTFAQCAKKQYIYVQAPAGYGKSVSTLLWLKKERCTAFSWIALDPYDNMLSLFYRSLCRSLLASARKNDAVSQVVNSPSFSASPVENTLEFLSMLEWLDEKYTLVLDDFHHITNEEIQKSLPYVLRRLPSSMNTLILSRAALPDAMRIMKERGETAFISGSELAFTAEEIQKHWAKCGRNITRQEADAIHCRTDGWVLILNVMMLGGDVGVPFQKSQPSLEEFFEKNIWNEFDEANQLFLIKTSMVDSFTLELCERMTGRTDCAETLDMLMRRNINLSYLGGEYRYHHLFLDFLRGKISESSVGMSVDMSAVYTAAADYCLSKKNVTAARRYAIMSGSFDMMMKAIHAIYKFRGISLDEYVGLANVFNQDQLPDSVSDQAPSLYMPQMFVAFLSGNSRLFENRWDKLYALLPVIAQKFPQLLESVITNSILDYRVKFSEHARHVRAMPAIACKNETDQVTAIAIHMPFLHRSSRDCYELTDAAVRESVVAEVFRDLLKYDCDNLFLGIEAGLYMEQNRLDEALAVLLRAEGVLNEKVSIDLFWATYLMLAEIMLLKSDRQGYERYKSQAKEYSESRGAFHYRRNFLAYETRVKLWDGDKEAARNWLSNYFVGHVDYSLMYKIFQNFVTARAYIALRKNTEALNVLHQIMALGEAFDRPLDVAEADVLNAIVEWISGKKKEARDRLWNRLVALRPYRFVRIVANEGKAVLPILAAVLKKPDKDADQDLLKFAKEVYIAAYEQSRRFRGLTYSQPEDVRLSQKQVLVLELLSKGYKNADIVKITRLSLNTIRSHTKIAYQKLDVKNALDAIAKAKQLGILS